MIASFHPEEDLDTIQNREGMVQERRPMNKKGERNPFCPFYRNCLDDAVEKFWAYWDCSECKHRSSSESHLEIQISSNESIAYYDFPADIFLKRH